jgi:hypothetical protein
VASIIPRAGPERVYNLEVAGEHVYQVSTRGFLVHNGCGRLVKETAKRKAKDPGHHPWPMYLGGPLKQKLETLPRPLHEAYHGGLDAMLPRQWGTEYYRYLTPLEQAENFEVFRLYTEAFDAKHGTSLWDAVKGIAAAVE